MHIQQKEKQVEQQMKRMAVKWQDRLCNSLTCHFAEVSPKEGVKVESKIMR